MDKFSIDDVRDSFAADISGQIAKLATAGRQLAESAELSWRPADIGQPQFESMSRAAHTIYGTSSLVETKSLYESARLLHIASALGVECMREIERQIQLSRSLGALCIEGSRLMDTMLALELNHRTEEAWAAALELRQKLSDWDDTREALEALPSAEAESPREAPSVAPDAFSFDEDEPSPLTPALAFEPREYSFEEEPAPVPPPSEATAEFSFDDLPAAVIDSGADLELLEVFQSEARECLVALQGYLQTLSVSPSDREAALNLERIYHTLKGAAATVGLTDVSAAAADLQDTLEVAIEKGAPLTRGFLDALVDRTNALFAAAQLPPVGLEAATMPSAEVHRLFLDDVRAVLDQIREPLRQLQDGVGGAAAILGRLFHRLKGSAAVASQLEVAEEAGRLQDLCESGSARRDPQEVVRGLAALVEHVTAGDPAEATPADAPPLREIVNLDVEPVIMEAFEIETSELLEAVDRTVVALENSQTPKREISALFRQYHTLKGSVNTVGLLTLGKMLHRLEDFLEELQEAPILPPLANLATLLLNVNDEVRRNLHNAHQGFLQVNVARIDSGIRALQTGGKIAPHTAREAARVSGSGGDSLRERRLSSRRQAFDKDMFERRFVRVSVARLDGLMNLTGELVVSRSRLARRVSALRGLQRDLVLSGGRVLKAVDRFRERHEFEIVDRRSAGGRALRAAAAPAARVTVSAGLAEFSDLELDRYGDVNILARTLNEMGHQMADVQGRMNESLDTFSEDAAAFSQIVTGLQGEITRARMVAVEQLFMRLRLPVRDAADREGKSVRVATFGEDVDLDKAIIDELYNPMLHLVRNCVSHGVETPEARRAAAKEPVGTVTLSARQESGQVVLEVTDDGAGLDLPRLHAIAIERGLLAAGTPVDDASVADIIFESGLTTRADVDEVSGRGVGCDVVRREVERLNGQVQVATTKGSGTTFTITLPLTLAITRALLLRHRGQTYAVPLGLAERIVDLEGAVVHESAGVRRVEIDGVYHALRSLDEVLALPARDDGTSAAGAALLLRLGENRLAVALDRVLGQEEIVVKGLGDVVSGHPLFSGVTVSGDGDLILILDVLGLMQKERRADATAAPAAGFAPPRRPRVLFIDDSLSVRTVAERFLTALGMDVTLAVDGEDGLARLRESAFDLVFTDLEMPRRHGYELLREIRRSPGLASLPVVVVTSRSGQKHREQAAALGASDYLTKPFTPDLLSQMIRKWVRIRES
jgi:chemosensory pili system protein ChpA (sensor histidine kinase/response regulator)